MRQLPTLLALAALASVSAAVPHSFSSGRPVVAQDVNENFVYLDTTQAKKADKADLDSAKLAVKGVQALLLAKADQGAVDARLGGKIDTASFLALQRKQQTDSAKLGAAIKGATVGHAVSHQSGGIDSILGQSLVGLRPTDAPSFSTLTLDAGATRYPYTYVRSAGSMLWSEYWSATAFELGARNADGAAIDWPLIIKRNAGGTIQLGGGTSRPLVLTGELQQFPAIPRITTAGVGQFTGLNIGSLAGILKATSGKVETATEVDLPFLKLDASPQTIGDNKSWVGQSSSLPGHYYTNLYASSNQTYVHYYPLEFNATKPSTPTYANLRVWAGTDGTTQINTLVLGGDGSLSWVVGSKRNTIAHSGNLAELKIMTLAGGTITGDLHIAGNLTATPKIPVADYVFEPDYQLAPLSEVEAYTKANKHLPEVPSASEIGKDGLDLAAMNLILLKKVEELTLHSIALEKRMNAMEAAQAR